MGFNLKYRHWNIITNMICMAPVMGRGHNAIRPEMLYTATWPWFMPYYLSSCGYIHQRLGDTLFHLAPFPVVLYCKNIPSFNHIGYVILVDFLFDFYSYEIWNMKYEIWNGLKFVQSPNKFERTQEANFQHRNEWKFHQDMAVIICINMIMPLWIRLSRAWLFVKKRKKSRIKVEIFHLFSSCY